MRTIIKIQKTESGKIYGVIHARVPDDGITPLERIANPPLEQLKRLREKALELKAKKK
jgi:hypothetical protein